MRAIVGLDIEAVVASQRLELSEPQQRHAMFEVHEHRLRAHDGWSLSVLDIVPATGQRAVVIAGHAMMVDRRTLYRPGRRCLAASLAAAGLRVLVPELRGRGASGPTPAEGADWTYASLIDDVPTYLQLAHDVAPGLPVFLVGHSLFANVSLAYLGQMPDAPVAGVVGLAVHIWNRRFVGSRARWLSMRLAAEASAASARALGYLAARRFKVGTADEARSYYAEMMRWIRTDSWGSANGIDYQANLRNVRCPVLHVVSDGDPWYGHPDQALAFTAPLRRREVLRLGQACSDARLHGVAPGHIAMVTSPRSEPLWRVVAEWIVARC